MTSSREDDQPVLVADDGPEPTVPEPAVPEPGAPEGGDAPAPTTRPDEERGDRRTAP